ncbi:hypothetical protein BS78_09G012100 [Paspalum vaginatum]|nr:hypothetical protein BS78_09G012100 [Paspalum vaginatum]
MALQTAVMWTRCLLLLLLFSLSPPTVAVAASSVSSGAEVLVNGSCIAAERDALFSFKAGITSDPSRLLRSWRGQDCCRWYGVRCSTKTGHVVKLDLRNGFFLDDFYTVDNAVHWLRGQISASLLSLLHLEHLDLSGNFLGGNMPIPKFMGSLQSLTYLNLSNMNFSGRVPPQLGNLTKLVYLDIHNDSPDTAYTYSSDVSWLASLYSLEHLDMSRVNLSATTDWVYSMNTLPNLRVLGLSTCGLISSIPSLIHHNLTVLEEVDLSNNPFRTPVAPNWYWDVTSLKSLTIPNCELSGPFPDELGNLTKLETLDMGSNNIEGMVPSTLNKLCGLQVIYLSYNNIGGDIIDLIERLPNCSWCSFQHLELAGANISGTTLKSILNLTSLSILDISDNYLRGSVPLEIGTLHKLTKLYIGSNNFSGVISEGHFSGLTDLKAVDLSYTNLRVMVHSDWEPPFNLDRAYLSSCHLGPQVPDWLRLQPSLSSLVISDAGLIGRIPDWFWTTFSNAAYLDLSYNQITGELPHNLEFMAVTWLNLQSNYLTGSVPLLPRSIQILDISKNSLNGQLPSKFKAPYLLAIVLFSNSLTGIIPDSICQWPQLQFLDLSNNLLMGGLPNCGIEDLKQLKPSSTNFSRVRFANSYSLEIRTLVLNNNSLSGGFPIFLKRCQNLMFLDLSQNKFSGKLPTWVSEDMPNLVVLRLRSNIFSGHIPIETTRLFSLPLLNLKALTTTSVALDTTVNNPFLEVYQFGYMNIRFGLSNDSLSLVTKGQVLDYRENAKLFTSIDLSCNRLTGQIPEEIGSLLGLINLNLSSNYLSGNIPYKISNLQSESLDLSNNQLSGRQLDTLQADDPTSVYIGNPGLCGHPLPKACPGDQPLQGPIIRHEDDKAQMEFHLTLILGFLLYDKMEIFSVVTWQKWFKKRSTN